MRSESSGGIAWDVISVAMCKYHQLINVDGIGQVSTGWGNSTFSYKSVVYWEFRSNYSAMST